MIKPLFVIFSLILVVFTLELFAGVFISRRPYSWNGYWVGDLNYDYRTPDSVDWDQFLHEAYVFDHSDYYITDEETGVVTHINY
jgi:hypothetical protein